MKKGFALLLAAVLMFAGCGSSSGSTGTPAPAETVKETEETQSEEAGTEAVNAEQTGDGTEDAANAAGTEAADAEQTESVENSSET